MLPIHSKLFLFSLLISIACANLINPPHAKSAPLVCVVQPNAKGGDDAPAIIAAFGQCGYGGKVIFGNHTYHVNTLMNITGLRDCEVELWGTLLWSSNTTYWLKNSMPIGYQNQSTVWFFGGMNITFNGFGQGTFDGNGQVWYDLVNGVSNYPHRPHALTIWKTKNSVFQGIRFIQSQMWTMTTMHSNNILLQDIYVNSTSHSKAPARNTDGADTIFSNNITFRRWSVDNGDDGIAVKANSSNILIEDSVFRRGQGIAVGSIGQYSGQYEFVENFTARNITTIGTRWAGYIKTWTGVQEGYPPNGGGGGTGYIKNITWHDFTMISNRGVLDITQCTSFSGYEGSCNTSTMTISNLSFENIHGTVVAGVSRLGTFSCSAAAPCHNITIGNVDVRTVGSGTHISGYSCTAVQGITGFTCS